MIRSGIAAVAAALVLVPAASAAAPVQGSLFGPVVSVKGTTFTITTTLSPSGKSLVSAGSAKITEQAAAPKSSLKVGACVMATGARNAKGVVAATRITISQPVKGSCTSGFAPRRTHGRHPAAWHDAADGRPAPAGRVRRQRQLRLRIRVGDEGERLDPDRQGDVVRIVGAAHHDRHRVVEDVAHANDHGGGFHDQGEDVRVRAWNEHRQGPHRQGDERRDHPRDEGNLHERLQASR